MWIPSRGALVLGVGFAGSVLGMIVLVALGGGRRDGVMLVARTKVDRACVLKVLQQRFPGAVTESGGSLYADSGVSVYTDRVATAKWAVVAGPDLLQVSVSWRSRGSAPPGLGPRLAQEASYLFGDFRRQCGEVGSVECRSVRIAGFACNEVNGGSADTPPHSPR